MHDLLKPPSNAFDILISSWQKWQGENEGLVPPKKSMSMRDLKDIMPFITILKLDSDGFAEYRVIGEQLKILYANDLTGFSTRDTYCVQDWQACFHQKMITSIIQTPQAILTERQVPGLSGQDWTYQTLTLPITNAQGEISYGLLCGKLNAPKEAPDHIWKGLLSFDMQSTYIKSMHIFDIGAGITDLSAHSDDKIDIILEDNFNNFLQGKEGIASQTA